MLPGFDGDSLPVLPRKPEKAEWSKNVELCWGRGSHDYGHISELLTRRQATSCLVGRLDSSGEARFFFLRGSPEHFSSFSYPLLPTDVSEGDLFRSDALFGALFFGHGLLRVIIKVELIMFPSTCNHLPYGGLMWKDSSPWGIYSRRHPAVLKGSVAEWLRVGAL